MVNWLPHSIKALLSSPPVLGPSCTLPDLHSMSIKLLNLIKKTKIEKAHESQEIDKSQEIDES